MAELKPTAARLDLLRAVEAGNVVYSTMSGNDLDRSRRPERKVNALMLLFLDADWVALRPEREGYWRRWKLTDAGRAVLADADAKQKEK